MTSGPNGTSLSYDPLGRLWRVSNAAGTTQFLYDGIQIAAEYNGAGAMTRRYYFGPNIDEPLLADPGASFSCGDLRFLNLNQQGSMIAASDCAGNRTTHASYDEYGIPASTNWGRFGYTGQAWIPEVKLWYYKNRMYRPDIGRFMQTDPIGYGAGPNLYAYVLNDPVNLVDPLGLEDEESGTPEPTPGVGEDILVQGSYEDWVISTISSGYQQFISNLNYLLGPVAARISAVCANNPTLCGAIVVKAKRRPQRRSIPIHYYGTLNLVIPCRASNAQIANMARRFAGPGQPARPIANGERFIARAFGQSGPVVTTFYDFGNFTTSVFTTINTTLPTHPLYLGSVTRDWFRAPNGSVWVNTVGRGQNTSRSMASVNTLAGPRIFNSVDTRARAYAEANICR